VSSAIINVDQDVDEPWPLEVIGHDGLAYNVTMEPGDLVLYESHSIIHGRQFPLKGRFMANIFIHFEVRRAERVDWLASRAFIDLRCFFASSQPIGPIDGAVMVDGDLPPYLIPGSEEETKWRASNPNGHVLLGQRQFTTGSTVAHEYAQFGDLASLTRYLDEHPEIVEHRDKNGWTPLAEGIRSGKKEVVELLLNRGSEVNAQVGKDQNGPSMLRLAKELVGADHEIISLLVSRGGRDFTGEEAATEL
jgi:prolyl 4-hydroxylase